MNHAFRMRIDCIDVDQESDNTGPRLLPKGSRDLNTRNRESINNRLGNNILKHSNHVCRMGFEISSMVFQGHMGARETDIGHVLENAEGIGEEINVEKNFLASLLVSKSQTLNFMQSSKNGPQLLITQLSAPIADKSLIYQRMVGNLSKIMAGTILNF